MQGMGVRWRASPTDISSQLASPSDNALIPTDIDPIPSKRQRLVWTSKLLPKHQKRLHRSCWAEGGGRTLPASIERPELRRKDVLRAPAEFVLAHLRLNGGGLLLLNQLFGCMRELDTDQIQISHDLD